MIDLLIITALWMSSTAALVAVLILYLDSRPIRVQVEIIGPVELAKNGEELRHAGNSIAFAVIEGTSLIASVMQRTLKALWEHMND